MISCTVCFRRVRDRETARRVTLACVTCRTLPGDRGVRRRLSRQVTERSSAQLRTAHRTTNSAGAYELIRVQSRLLIGIARLAAAMMLTPRGKCITYNAIGHVGVQARILHIPIPAIEQWASDKLNGKREVFNQSKEILGLPAKARQVDWTADDSSRRADSNLTAAQR